MACSDGCVCRFCGEEINLVEIEKWEAELTGRVREAKEAQGRQAERIQELQKQVEMLLELNGR